MQTKQATLAGNEGQPYLYGRVTPELKETCLC